MGKYNRGETVSDFMAIVKSIDCNSFERFSHVAEKNSTNLLSSCLECFLSFLIDIILSLQ